MEKRVLMGTILSRSSFPHKPLRDLVDALDVKRVFVFSLEGSNQFLLTYNIDKSAIETKLPVLTKTYRNTLRLHRKRSKNAFFTINAITKLEKKNKIDWKDYEDCILMSKDEKVFAMKHSLLKIIRI